MVQPVQPLGSTFLGIFIERSVTGTAGDNKFSVSPSKTTSICDLAAIPPAPPPDGDILSINLSGTSGSSPLTPGCGPGYVFRRPSTHSYMGFEQTTTTSQLMTLAASSEDRAPVRHWSTCLTPRPMHRCTALTPTPPRSKGAAHRSGRCHRPRRPTACPTPIRLAPGPG